MSSECEGIQAALFDYSVGELDEARSAEISAHIANCAECSKRMTELEGTGMAMRKVSSLRDIEATEELQNSTRRLARVESQKRVAISMDRGADLRRMVTGTAPRPASRTKPGAMLLAAAAAIGIIILILVIVNKFHVREDAAGNLGNSVAALDASSGKVEVFFRKRGTDWAALDEGRRVFRGESIRTSDSVARFACAGERTVWLGPESRASFVGSRNDKDVVVRLEEGSLVVASHGKAFRVEADLCTMTSSGGAVSVRHAGDAVVASVFAGKVRMVPDQGFEVDLKAGERAAMGAGGVVETGEANLAETALWRFRTLDDATLDALFEGPARLINDGRAFIVCSTLDWIGGGKGDSLAVKPGGDVRFGGRFTGDISVAVEADDWSQGDLTIGLSGGDKVEYSYTPGEDGRNLARYPFGGKTAKGSGDPLPADIGPGLIARVERVEGEFRIYIGDRQVGRFKTDDSSPVVPFLRANGKAVTVRLTTVAGRPEETWVGEKLGVRVPGK